MTRRPSSSLGERLAVHVAGKASQLQARYRANESTAVAELALLRRGASMPLGNDVRLTGLALAGLYDDPRTLPDEPQAAERAAYAALTLFALHQQSHRTQSMHRVGYSLGESARLLGSKSGAHDAVRRRFNALATAVTWDETIHFARSMIQQLRSYDIQLDYGQFARDLLSLQSPKYADSVRLVWGRDFYRVPREEGADEEQHGA